ncbi:MAG: DsbA family protein [Rhodospirillales bacterium]|nr:DsbA family protein [Rhodospirillales bacterium]
MTRLTPSLALIAVLLVPLAALGTANAAIVSMEEAKTEMSIGKADAPVTIIEFSSLGCPHCAKFHRDTLPQIKKDYIDTGKVRLIFQDFPLGNPALAASMVARCSGPKKFFGFIEILFRSQAQWANSKNPLQALSQVARFGGMSEDDVQACLKYQSVLEHIRQGALVGQEKYKINSTPSFVIGKEIISGAHPFEVFQEAIDKALKK